MKLLITNDNIRILSFIIVVFIIVILWILYRQFVLRKYKIKIYNAVISGDKEKALLLINLSKRKRPMTVYFDDVYKLYEDKFESNEA